MKDRISTPFWVRPLQEVQKRVAVRGQVHLEERVHVGLGTTMWAPGRLVVRHDVYIGRSCLFECDGEIGSGTLIGNHVALLGRYDHATDVVGTPMVAAPWIGNPDYRGEGRDLSVVIEPDCWIGYGAIVLSGAHVGRGAVVAAGSVVVGNVEPYDMVVGNPSRSVGSRMAAEDRAEHERILAERWGIRV